MPDETSPQTTIPSRLASIGRHPGDLARLTAAAAVFCGCAAAAASTTLPVRTEVDVFRVFNDLPAPASIILRPGFQAGSAAAIAIAGALALFLNRMRLGIKLVVGGSAAWVCAYFLQYLFDRPRPYELLRDVIVHGSPPGGPGFPSTHVAVATALATVAAPYVGTGARRAAWAIVGVVTVAAMYTGSNLPLDAVAGATLGWWCGTLLHLLWGAPGRAAGPDLLRAALAGAGMEVSQLHHILGAPWGATEYSIVTKDGDRLFARVVRRRRNYRHAYRARRYLAALETPEDPPFDTPKHEVEHEAYISLLAERAGVRTPPVVLARELHEDAAVIVRRAVDARRLDHLTREAIDDTLLEAAWHQIALLRAGRIAHHDLVGDRILVDRRRRVWIGDFRQARAGASDDRMAQDVAEVLVCLTSVVGARRAVSAGAAVLGAEALAAALPYLRPLALPARVRRQLPSRTTAWVRLRAEVADLTGEGLPAMRPGVRASTVLGLAVAGGAVYILLPQVGSVGRLVQSLLQADWSWVAIAYASTLATFPAAALAYLGACQERLPPLKTVVVQVASAFTSRVTPAGLGGIGLNLLYMERCGVERTKAVAAAAANGATGALIHAIAVCAVLAFLGTGRILGSGISSSWPVVAGVIVALIATGAVLYSPFGRRRFIRPGLEALDALRVIMRTPKRLLMLVAGASGVTILNALALAACLRGFGAAVSVFLVIAVYLAGSAIAAPSPTPGALGAVEAALVAGLTGIGVQTAPAIAAVLTFRLLNFWIPIPLGLLMFRYLQHRKVV